MIGIKIDQRNEGIVEKSIVLSLCLSLIFIVETHLPNTSEFSALVTSSEIKRKGKREWESPSGWRGGLTFSLDGGFNKVCVEQVSLARRRKEKNVKSGSGRFFSKPKRILAFIPAFGFGRTKLRTDRTVNPPTP